MKIYRLTVSRTSHLSLPSPTVHPWLYIQGHESNIINLLFLAKYIKSIFLFLYVNVVAWDSIEYVLYI